MRYLGGKYRIRRHIASAIAPFFAEGAQYYEPFVGSAAIAEAVAEKFPNTELNLSDTSEDLILMWQAVCSGWIPPENVTEEEYKQLRTAEPSALRGFVGYGCSFAGKFFGGYARDPRGGKSIALETRAAVLRSAALLTNAKWSVQSYTAITPQKGDVVYCDPPYINTTGYTTGTFDHTAFWNWVKELHTQGVIVLVSEYTAPSQFTPIWTKLRSTSVRPKFGNEQRLECLFRANT